MPGHYNDCMELLEIEGLYTNLMLGTLFIGLLIKNLICPSRTAEIKITLLETFGN